MTRRIERSPPPPLPPETDWDAFARRDAAPDRPDPVPRAARVRLDALMTERGLCDSRSRAADAVRRGHVTVDGRPAARASMLVSPEAAIRVEDPASPYVSRASLKLLAGLDAFSVDPAGRLCLDVGASTGGFTQVLLERGADHVLAVDVGRDQMHPSLRDDPRVTLVEGLNAREMSLDDLGGLSPDLVVADVSFISLTLALPPALALAEPGSDAILLVKPQFEAGREAVARNGMLRDPASAPAVAERLLAWLDACPGWRATHLLPSPILGGDGNAEFLLHGRKDR